MRPRALDLFCRAGGISEGLRRAGFDVVGVDILDCSKAYNKGPGNPAHENPARFHQVDALKVLDEILKAQRGGVSSLLDHMGLGPIDLICASPPCQAHSVLRHLTKGKEYPDLIPQTRERLRASGIPYAIENVPGSPLEGSPLVLCGTMFGLGTPDGRAELRRHRHFETSFPVTLRPECRHGRESLTVSGTGMGPGNVGKDAEMKAKRAISVVGAKGLPGVSHRRALAVAGNGTRAWNSVITVTGDRCNSSNTPKVISITGSTPQRQEVHNTIRETFSTDDARHAMGIYWMTMKDLSQAIPPAYAHFLGLMFLGEDPTHLLVEGGCMGSLF